MIHVVRLLVAVLATLMLVGGLAALVAGFRLEGLYVAGLGAAGLVIVVLERQRYGDATDEQPVSADRLRQTDEVFVDPTTGQRTRVWIDPQTGERSYRPE
jgi:membrane protein implicated in regulation of membrane protease activity